MRGLVMAAIGQKKWGWGISAGIYHNPTNGLISISSDGINWITIADKNLWATQVYNNGDALSETNCGKYFQWWNDYWFPWINSSEQLNTSSTQFWDTWKWPYYSNILYSGSSSDWRSNNNTEMWWMSANNVQSRRWPCENWFHIPLASDWSDVVNIISALNVGNPRTVLLIPDSDPRVWCSNCTPASLWVCAYFYNYGNSISTQNQSTKNTFWIRPFKDESVAPNSSRTVLFDWSSVAAWAWIFHNNTDWLISLSSDWINWVTIADKNLWATQVYNSWDTSSEVNCGKKFQWWNCYWFPYDLNSQTTSTIIDVSGYWPRCYSDVFIIWNKMWSTNLQYTLWWAESDITWARRWPCNIWFHVPKRSEFNNLLSIWGSLWAWSYSESQSWYWWVKTYLKMPDSWAMRYTNWTFSSTLSYYRETTTFSNSSNSNKSNREIQISWSYMLTNYREPWYWSLIRPFKDEPVTPDSSWTVLYQPQS